MCLRMGITVCRGYNPVFSGMGSHFTVCFLIDVLTQKGVCVSFVHLLSQRASSNTGELITACVRLDMCALTLSLGGVRPGVSPI